MRSMIEQNKTNLYLYPKRDGAGGEQFLNKPVIKPHLPILL